MRSSRSHDRAVRGQRAGDRGQAAPGTSGCSPRSRANTMDEDYQPPPTGVRRPVSKGASGRARCDHGADPLRPDPRRRRPEHPAEPAPSWVSGTSSSGRSNSGSRASTTSSARSASSVTRSRCSRRTSTRSRLLGTAPPRDPPGRCRNSRRGGQDGDHSRRRPGADPRSGGVIRPRPPGLLNGLWEAGAEAVSINRSPDDVTGAIRFAGEAITVNFSRSARPT